MKKVGLRKNLTTQFEWRTHDKISQLENNEININVAFLHYESTLGNPLNSS